MNSNLMQLQTTLTEKLSTQSHVLVCEREELTLEIPKQQLHDTALLLRDDPGLRFNGLIDICGVDYLHYGVSEWMTAKATGTSFDRAVDHSGKIRELSIDRPRFSVVYHLLSYAHNHRLRMRVSSDEDPPIIDSVVDIWPAANWFEREAFDLFGILFNGHPDLRRLLTDYGFIGHPFRKDFPVTGTVEIRYDAAQKRVIYEPIDITMRTLVPKVIREDNRYLATEEKKHG